VSPNPLVGALVVREGEVIGEGYHREIGGPHAELEAIMASSIPVKIDIESPEGKAIAARYSIEEAPAVLITTPQGRLVFLMQGFMNQGEFFRHAYAAIAGYRKWAKEIDVQNVASLSAKEAFDSGNELYHRSDDDEATVRHRMAVYVRDTAPLIDYYEAQGKLERVDGGRPIDEVYASLDGIIRGAKV